MEARFLFAMTIEMTILDKSVMRSKIQAGPKDVQGHPPYEYPIGIEDVPEIFARIGARLVGHDENPALVVGEKLVERGKRIGEVLVLRNPRPSLLGSQNGLFDLFSHTDPPMFLPDFLIMASR
jgi:hypothetical protein